MARRTARRFQRRVRRMNGRQGLWLRQPAFSPTEVEGALGTYADIVAQPSDWERNVQIGTQTMKGAGASRLERMFGQFHFSAVWDEPADRPVSPGIEVMVWDQSSEFASIVTGSASFDDVLENQRILWHKTYQSVTRETKDRGVLDGTCEFEVKSKVRLADRSIGLAIRLGFDVDEGTRLTDVLANWTGYVTTP